ncbi:MAG: FG-GAP repeat protein, partial [Planctomycetes bacterium]|nr:FG-GAP repeat protein [Planctomycetota bacterium]
MNPAPRSLMTILAIGLCALAAADGSFAQSACQAVRLTASDGATFDSFGYSVAVSDDTALIGAQWDNDLGTNSGSVYVLRRDGTTWVEVQ